MRTIMRYVTLYLAIQKANIKSRMMYPFNFFLGIFCVMAFGIFQTMLLWVLTQKFPVVVGWEFYEILFNAAFVMFCYSLSMALFIQLQEIDFYVRQAEFDRILVRPMNPLLQFACKRINLNGLGTVGYSFIVLIYSGYQAKDWSLLSIFEGIVLLLCGLVSSLAIHLIIASTSFLTLQSGGLFEMKEVIYDNVADYPLAIFSKGIQVFLTFFLPIGFIGLYASAYLLNKQNGLFFGNFGFLICIVGSLLLAVISYGVWAWSLRHYSGAGS